MFSDLCRSFRFKNVSAQGCKLGKLIWSNVDVGEQLTKSREPQRSKESTGGQVLPVGLKVLPVELAEKLAVDKSYR